MKSLSTDPMQISTRLNKNEIVKWHVLLDTLKSYKTAGIQVFSHTHYEVYKCQGPYDKDWGCCSAAWHPSLKGHQLRAAHHSVSSVKLNRSSKRIFALFFSCFSQFFWLLIFKDAVEDLIKKLSANKVYMKASLGPSSTYLYDLHASCTHL